MTKNESPRIVWFKDISLSDVSQVGGKNASLGEMYRELVPNGINVPNGFATTAEAYREFLQQQNTRSEITSLLDGLNIQDIEELQDRATSIRRIILHTPLPTQLEEEIVAAYQQLCDNSGEWASVAVRSSATAEDLPQASFAGQQESYLNIKGEQALLNACLNCFASLFTERAISYRTHQGFDHLSVALSIGVQKMVRSDLACSGVLFTVDTESGFPDAVVINGSYGLGENVVQGKVTPDEYVVFKPTLLQGFRPIVTKTLGSKKIKLIYGDSHMSPTKNVRVARDERKKFMLSDDEVLQLSNWAIEIEKHYSEKHGQPTPMDVEWAKDGETSELYIVQARPETVVSQEDRQVLKQYRLTRKSPVLAMGQAIGQGIGAGLAHIIHSSDDIRLFKPGEVLVTDTTDPDWEPIMKQAAAIVTNQGGRTSHAAIVSRELGIPCVVGTIDGTNALTTNAAVTINCSEGGHGFVHSEILPFTVDEIHVDEVPKTETHIALNLGNPHQAFAFAALPHDGIGLARQEFIVSSSIGIHPCALAKFEQIEDQELRREIDKRTPGYSNKSQFFIDKLAEGIGKIAAAFHPKPVIARMSDFKSNEYANLLGGDLFEPNEENPMLGWRGASRYYSKGYQSGFALECEAIKKVRQEFGLKNLTPMIPFCRTVEEGKRVLAVMAENGLVQGEDGLQIFAMCEIPSNVLLAEQFLEIFDGFSIGTNDLTQLTLGIDRDSPLVAEVFDERNEAVKLLVRNVIEVANRKGKYIGICGDAPSTFPEFTEFLVEAGIKTISVSPDVLLRTRLLVAEAEQRRSPEVRAAIS